MSDVYPHWDPIERWRQDSRSSISFNSRLVILQGFLRFHKTTAEGLLLLARKMPSGIPQFEIEKMVADYLNDREKNGYANSTIAKEADIISGFLRVNNVIIKTPKKYFLKSTYEHRRVLTQDEVREMLRATKELEEQAVICFEAQTAQRIGILTGLTWDMIHRYPVEGTDKVYGVAEVMPEIVDRKGRHINKTREHYSFGVHWESMRLLDKLKERRKVNDPFIWTMDKRRMQEAVSNAAKDAGIQKFQVRTLKVKGKKKRKWSEIHAHVFRRFWMAQMDTAGIKNEKLLDFQLGHAIKDSTYRHGWFVDEKIVEAIKKADEQLRVLPSV